MPTSKSLLTTAIIAGLVAIGPLATDMYLPAFPVLGEVFATDSGSVQQTLSLFLVGFAAAQLICGPLSDRFGRKPVLLGGLVLFMLSSCAIIWSQNIEQLALLRFFQALGGSVGPVLGRAMVRDIYGPDESARLLSYIGTAMALAPAAAPIVGSYLLAWFGWQSIFVFLFLFALIGAILLVTRVPETAPESSGRVLGLTQMLNNYRLLLQHKEWRWFTLCCSFVFAGLFSFLSGAPFVIITFLGFSEEAFSLFFALVVFGFMFGTLIGGRWARRMGILRLIRVGASIAALGGIIMGLLAFFRVDHIAAIIIPHMLYMVGVGIVMPQSMAGALAPFPEIAGSSSALLGFIQMTFSAIIGLLVGQYHDGTQRSMAFSIALMGVLTFISYTRLIQIRRRQEVCEG